MAETTPPSTPQETIVEQLGDTAAATRAATIPVPDMYSYHGGGSSEAMTADGPHGSSQIFYDGNPASMLRFDALHAAETDQGSVEVDMRASSSREFGIDQATTSIVRRDAAGNIVHTFESQNPNTARRVGKLVAAKVVQEADRVKAQQQEVGNEAPIEVLEGATSFEEANTSMMPVEVAISRETDEETDEPTGYWKLVADAAPVEGNAGRVVEGFYGVRSHSLDQLRTVVGEQILPIYEATLKDLQDMSTPSPEGSKGGAVEVVDQALSFDGAGAYDVPLHVRLAPEVSENDGQPTGTWKLTADWYEASDIGLGKDEYQVRSTDPEALKAVVADHVVPIYEAATTTLQGIAEGTGSYMFAWQAPKRVLPDAA